MIGSLTPHTLANDARMRRALFGGVFLFVEGTSDEKFYGKFLSNGCQTIICHGRANVRDCCRILETADFKGAIGIIDADFNHLEGKPTGVASVFHTDMHDAESFLLATDAFHKVIQEFSTSEKLKIWQSRYAADLRRQLLQGAAAVGSLLWHSIEKGLELHFHELDSKQYVEEGSLIVNLSRLVKHVKNKSQRQDLSEEILIAAIEDKLKTSRDFWQLARSHDITEMMGFAFRRTLGNCKALDVCRERIEQCLRLAYVDDDFNHTQLFRDIRSWEMSNSPFRVFRNFSQTQLLLE